MSMSEWRDMCRTIDVQTAEIASLRDQLEAMREALERLKYPSEDCWCEVATGNPNYKGKHASFCRTNAKLLADTAAAGQAWRERVRAQAYREGFESATRLHGPIIPKFSAAARPSGDPCTAKASATNNALRTPPPKNHWPSYWSHWSTLSMTTNTLRKIGGQPEPQGWQNVSESRALRADRAAGLPD